MERACSTGFWENMGSTRTKGKGKEKEVRSSGGLERACSTGFWENMGSTRTKGSMGEENAGGKESTWEESLK